METGLGNLKSRSRDVSWDNQVKDDRMKALTQIAAGKMKSEKDWRNSPEAEATALMADCPQK